MKKFIRLLLEVSLALVIAVILTSSVFAISNVDGPSMESTLYHNEKLFIDKLTYNFKEPQHGDLIIFLKGETIDGLSGRLTNTFEDMLAKVKGDVRRNRLVKRVVGLPGDVIDIRDNLVYRNDVLLEESYAKGLTYKREIQYPFEVPQGSVFVLGDNREVSNDSRAFGPVQVTSIEGLVRFRIWPFTNLD